MSAQWVHWFHSDGAARKAAAQWLARRDRGLSPREQDHYLEWLHADERHAAAMTAAEATLRRMLQLHACRDRVADTPNADILAPRRRRPVWVATVMSAAALVTVTLGLWTGHHLLSQPAAAHRNHYLRVNDRMVLPDGSHAELKDGTTMEVRYTPAERRVRLTGGEALFSVEKDPARPFVVEAGGVAVRAVGTVFDVRLGNSDVKVLVTEGKVRVGLAAHESGRIFEPHGLESEPPTVAAGQQAVVAWARAKPAPVVENVSAEEIQRDLAWQAPRLQFDDTPLAEAIAEFNQRNRRQIVLGDPQLGRLTIGGRFRPENVDGFVRLLSVTLGIEAVSRGPDEIVLVRAK